MMPWRWVRLFRDGGADESALLGGKGANLAEMTGLGLPVPPGFTITTAACHAVLAEPDRTPAGLWDEIEAALAIVESQSGKRFGDPAVPLLLSVRSGAQRSMPGMMDTILNLGLNDETAAGLGRLATDQFAADCYRRLVQMYGKVALGLPGDRLHPMATGATPLNVPASRQGVAELKHAIAGNGAEFPDDPRQQLRQAVLAVFRSWNTPRAIAYRRAHGISHDLGTAATVQAMVFGNMGPESATGVAFTRDPNTGAPGLFGEYLPNAQGEDIVAGERTPLPLAAMAADPVWRPRYDQLAAYADQLEAHYADMQDIEFTVENGTLWLLQTRTGQRTAKAAVRIAVDLATAGQIDRATAVRRVSPDQVERLLHPSLDESHTFPVLATGLAASPGAATGQVVFDPEAARRQAEGGTSVILVRQETAAEDFPGMERAAGILTARGGVTSHAAVVARGMGIPAVTGCEALEINEAAGRFRIGEETVLQGEEITIDGTTGQVVRGRAPMVEPDLSDELDTLLAWADGYRRLQVRANADTPADAARARAQGAEGIGLCRTEHMFFGEGRIDAMREMILAETDAARDDALNRLEAFQTADFEGIFRAMNGWPVVIRLLDPPLHEFLPSDGAATHALASRLGRSPAALASAVTAQREINPMLGFRGCRLGVTMPAITRMQTRAILRAAHACVAAGIQVEPEIMVPLVSDPEELRRQREVIRQTAAELSDELGEPIAFRVGTMIELPRAALLAAEIATHADFFSFGTNDLTQTTYGLSRDDAGRFLPGYLDHGVFPADPFRVLDRDGVGQLVALAVDRGRLARPGLMLGACGEHGGDPASIACFDELGLDYVSCSPYRVPVARLAAAQAALAEAEPGPELAPLSHLAAIAS